MAGVDARGRSATSRRTAPAPPLGDPIEVAALTQAFGAGRRARGFCALGSVKTNIGHLDAAAGVAGLIKAVLALEHGELPPSLHFERPNPRIDFDGSPFYVNTRAAGRGRGGARRGGRASAPSASAAPTRTSCWRRRPRRRRAGAVAAVAAAAALGAHARRALDAATAQPGRRTWTRHPELPLADVAYTLQVGRRALRAPPRAWSCRDARGRRGPRSRGRAHGARAARRRDTRAARGRSCSRARARSTWAWAASCTSASPSSATQVDALRELLQPAPGLRPARRAATRPAATRSRPTRRAAAQTALTPSPRCSSSSTRWRSCGCRWGVQPAGDDRPQPGRVRGRVPGRRASRWRTRWRWSPRAAG